MDAPAREEDERAPAAQEREQQESLRKKEAFRLITLFLFDCSYGYRARYFRGCCKRLTR